MRRYLLAFFIVSLLILGAILFRSQSTIQKPQDRQIVDLVIGEKGLRVEVVNSSESVTLGLSGRDQIGSDGMLFMLGSERVPKFWMKEMQFDLDLIWIRDLEVIEITDNIPKPSRDESLSQLPTYSPLQVVDMVLEVRGGDAQRFDIKVGDQLELSK